MGKQNHPGSPMVTLRMPQAVVDYLDTVAAEAGASRSTLVRAAVQQVTPAHLWAAENPNHQLAAGTADAVQVLRDYQQVSA
jgi:metal-responsive CopG/Arc/MetJ family transcriptional regulator